METHLGIMPENIGHKKKIYALVIYLYVFKYSYENDNGEDKGMKRTYMHEKTLVT